MCPGSSVAEPGTGALGVVGCEQKGNGGCPRVGVVTGPNSIDESLENLEGKKGGVEAGGVCERAKQTVLRDW